MNKKLSFNEEIELIAKNTKKAVIFFERILKTTFVDKDNFKGVSYIVFDKNFNPYLVMPERDYDARKNYGIKEISFEVYAIEEETYEIPQLEYVGYFDATRNGKLYKIPFDEKVSKEVKRELARYPLNRKDLEKAIKQSERVKRAKAREGRFDTLDRFEIMKEKYIGKGLGKELFKVFEYNSFIMGAKKMNGIASPLNEAFIKRSDLHTFYKDRGVTVSKDCEMKKEYDNFHMKEYAKRIATYKHDGKAIKVVFPKYTKELVIDILASQKGNLKNAQKTSLLANVIEF